MVDPEGESKALASRSAELIELLRAGVPSVDKGPVREALAESRRLGAAAHRARQDVAVKVALNVDPGCPVSRAPAIRRVRTDLAGHDVDPLHGRSAVTEELLRFWQHRKDTVAAVIADVYRKAAEATPFSQSLTSAVFGHLSVLRDRRSYQLEGGNELELAFHDYEQVYQAVKEGLNEAEMVSVEAEDRLQSLKRVAAESLVTDPETSVKGLIHASISMAADSPVSAQTGLPVGQRAARPENVGVRSVDPAWVATHL